MANRIDTTLAALREVGKPALAPFITMGFPDAPTSEALAEGILEAGADMLELGIPFSDPLADGPVIQMTSFRALEGGATLASSLAALRSLRGRGVDAPLIFMGYLNPYLRYGMERFAADAAAAGLDGMIIPDLPPEESPPYQAVLEAQGIYLIPLLAPTSTEARITQVCKQARGFIYCVSVTGTTGERSALSAGVEDLAASIRSQTDLPVIVGFGVSQNEHVRRISGFADGAAVGSALLDAVDRAPEGEAVAAAQGFIRRLRGEAPRE